MSGRAGESDWAAYRGQGDGSLWVGGYTSTTAPFAPADPATNCSGTCRATFIASLNATSFPA